MNSNHCLDLGKHLKMSGLSSSVCLCGSRLRYETRGISLRAWREWLLVKQCQLMLLREGTF